MTEVDRMAVIMHDEREDAYQRGRESGRMDEREAAIKAGVFREGRYLTPDELTRGAVEALRFYAEREAWGPSDPDKGLPRVDLDGGAVARQALDHFGGQSETKGRAPARAPGP